MNVSMTKIFVFVDVHACVMLAFFAQMSKPEISVTGDSSGFRAVPGHKGHSKSLVP